MSGSDINVVKVRELYYKAAGSKSESEIFYNVMQSSTVGNKQFVQAYQGMSFMIKANFAFNPYYKLSYFVQGKDLLEKAISTDPENIEYRFLRYCIQTNAPVFLAYTGKIAEDQKVIRKYFSKLDDHDLKKRIGEYMVNSKYCSAEEKKIFSLHN